MYNVFKRGRDLIIMTEIHEEMKIILSGDDEIEIETLSNVLKGTIDSLKALTDEDIEKGGYRKFVVKDVTKGSFIVEIWSYLQANSRDISLFAFSALSAFAAFLEIKKHLKGKKPSQIVEQGNKVIITNNENTNIFIDKLIFDRISSDSDVERGINKVLKSISEDDSREGISVEHRDVQGNVDVINLSKDEASVASNPLELNMIVEKVVEDINDPINIRLWKIDLVGDSRWSIIYGSNRELVSILDEEFLKKVKSGILQFGSNTILKVKLSIRYKVDENGQILLNKKTEFAILKVYEVINEEIPDQASLFN